MNYKKINAKNYQIHLIKTDKFKKTTINITFKQPITDKLDVIKKDILCNLLILGTKKYKTRRELEIKCEDLFGASINIKNKKAGSYNLFSLTSSFLNDKYTLENTLDETINFIKEILFNPLIENNRFDDKLVEIAKKGYLEDIKSIPDNPSQYSVIKMRNFIDKESLYAFSPYFYIDKINDITNDELVNIYYDIMNNSQVDISIIGNITDDVLNYFEDLPIKSNKYNNSVYELVNNNDSIKIIEEGKYSQSKLVISYSFNNSNDFEKMYVAYILSFILGGSSDSLLFKKLRQNNSLCYYADSYYVMFYQILEINVGLESKNYDKAVILINESIKDIINGKITEEDIENAKITYINAWKEIMDNPLSIINMYLSQEYYGLDLVAERINKINKITKKDIISLVSKLTINATYLLKGMNEDE